MPILNAPEAPLVGLTKALETVSDKDSEITGALLVFPKGRSILEAARVTCAERQKLDAVVSKVQQVAMQVKASASSSGQASLGGLMPDLQVFHMTCNKLHGANKLLGGAATPQLQIMLQTELKIAADAWVAVAQWGEQRWEVCVDDVIKAKNVTELKEAISKDGRLQKSLALLLEMPALITDESQHQFCGILGSCSKALDLVTQANIIITSIISLQLLICILLCY